MDTSAFRSIAGEAGNWLPCFGTEIVLVLGILATLLAAAAFREAQERFVPHLAVLVCLAGIAAAFRADLTLGSLRSGIGLFLGAAWVDGFTLLVKILVLGGTAISLWLAGRSSAVLGGKAGEYSALMLSAALGACLLVSAADMVVLWLSLELIALSSVALAGCRRGDSASHEAGLKLLVYGGAASGVVLVGVAFLYGVAGSTRFEDVSRSLSTAGPMWPVLLFVFSGLLLRLSVVPFHAWTLDAYEGSPAVSTAFFSVVPVTAAFAALLRLTWVLVPASSPMESMPAEFAAAFHAARDALARTPVLPFSGILAVLTIAAGGLLVLRQENAKRILAGSVIVHAGTTLLAVSAFPSRGACAAILFLLFSLLFMSLGAFAVLVAAEDRSGRCRLSDLRGFGRERPALAAVLAVSLLGLAGVPGTAGFIGKLLIFKELAGTGAWTLLAVGILGSLPILYAFARVLGAVLFEEVRGPVPPRAAPRGVPWLACVLAAATLYLGVLWSGSYHFLKSSIPSSPPWSVPGVRR